ncbi:unnamed protein product [Brassica oleracea]
MEATIFKKSRSSSSTLAMHKQSYSITKTKPKIRIIHIFAPEIIKTDVANFRELVQSLTGKPEDHGVSRTKTRRGTHRQVQDMINMEKPGEVERCDDQGFCSNSEMEDMSMTWNGDNDGGELSGGFLNGMGDFGGFIQELGEFPYLPSSAMDFSASSNSSSSSHLHGGSIFSDSHHQF